MPKNYINGSFKSNSLNNDSKKNLSTFISYNKDSLKLSTNDRFSSLLSGLNIQLHDGKVWKELTLPSYDYTITKNIKLNSFIATKPIGYFLITNSKKNKKSRR